MVLSLTSIGLGTLSLITSSNTNYFPTSGPVVLSQDITTSQTYNFLSAIPFEIFKLSGIGATTIATQLKGKMGLGGSQSLTSSMTMPSNPTTILSMVIHMLK